MNCTMCCCLPHIYTLTKNHKRLKTCAMYWHFDFLNFWLILFKCPYIYTLYIYIYIYIYIHFHWTLNPESKVWIRVEEKATVVKQFKMRWAWIEHATFRSSGWCSPNWAIPAYHDDIPEHDFAIVFTPLIVSLPWHSQSALRLISRVMCVGLGFLRFRILSCYSGGR